MVFKPGAKGPLRHDRNSMPSPGHQNQHVDGMVVQSPRSTARDVLSTQTTVANNVVMLAGCRSERIGQVISDGTSGAEAA